MPTKAAKPFVLADAASRRFRHQRPHQSILDRELARGSLACRAARKKGRDIASIVAHMHNVRVMWLKAAGGNIPEKLDKSKVTSAQAKKALAESRAAIHDLLHASLAADGRIKGFRPDAAGFVGYLIAHDAHHRGQITMLARQAGHPISQKAMFGMWEWGARGSIAATTSARADFRAYAKLGQSKVE